MAGDNFEYGDTSGEYDSIVFDCEGTAGEEDGEPGEAGGGDGGRGGADDGGGECGGLYSDVSTTNVLGAFDAVDEFEDSAEGEVRDEGYATAFSGGGFGVLDAILLYLWTRDDVAGDGGVVCEGEEVAGICDLYMCVNWGGRRSAFDLAAFDSAFVWVSRAGGGREFIESGTDGEASLGLCTTDELL